MTNEQAVYIPQRFSDMVHLHLVRNLQSRPPDSAPLLLGVHGRPGEGKTFQLRKILDKARVHTVLLSGGQLESSDAGEPGARVRDAYLAAGSAISNGIPAAVVLNDADAAIGNWGELTQYTVNTQNVITELMHLCDYPTAVEGKATARAPIFLTGNDFTRLYGPLCRHGRMELFRWEISPQERGAVLAGVFPSLSPLEIDKMIAVRPGYSIADWTAAAARVNDNRLMSYLASVDIPALLARVVQGARLEGADAPAGINDVLNAVDYLDANAAFDMLNESPAGSELPEERMAITRTATSTATYTRQDLIELQVSRILARAGVSASSSATIIKGLRKRWIAEISLYGMNARGLCSGELYVQIDWQRNTFHVAAGKDTISLDQSWNDGISVEVEKTLSLFLDFISAEGLETVCHTRYAPGVNRTQANRVLGFSPAKRVTWVSGSIGTAMTIPELDEFTIGVKFSQ